MKNMDIKNLKNLSVLVAEDDVTLCRSFSQLLENFFHSVHSCGNGSEALNLYHAHSPDIIFTDISMPVMNGIDLVKKIRVHDEETIIVIVTAFCDKEYLLDAVKLHLDDYLIKPLVYDTFMKLLQKISSKIDNKKVFLRDNVVFVPFANRLQNNMTIYNLSPKEAKLLKLLYKYKNSLVSYEQIEQSVWHDEGMSQNAIRALIKSLRKKGVGDSIQNISKEGYLLNI